MSNAAKLVKNIKNKEKKPSERVKRIKKADLSSLPEAIVDGKLVVREKGRVLFERTLNKRTAIHAGIVLSVDKDGIVSIWDETQGQCCVVDLKNPPASFKAASSDELASE